VVGFGVRAYKKVGLETGVITSDPHKLVLMLFDGALLSIQRAKAFMAQKQIAEKGNAIGHAIEIVDSGLRVSVDPSADPEFAERLVGLYRYITMRLLQANLRNDLDALDEAAKILGDLRSAWLKIAPTKETARPQETSVPASGTSVASPGPAARRALAAYLV